MRVYSKKLYNSDGELDKQKRFFYNDDGLLETIFHYTDVFGQIYRPDNNIKYNNNNQIIEISSSWSGKRKEKSREIRKYNKLGLISKWIHNVRRQINTTIIFQYNNINQLIKKIEYDGNEDKLIKETNYDYDTDGNLIRDITNYADSDEITENTYFYQLGKLIITEWINNEGTESQSSITTFKYNENGKLLHEYFLSWEEEKLRKDYFYNTDGLLKRLYTREASSKPDNDKHFGYDEYEYEDGKYFDVDKLYELNPQ